MADESVIDPKTLQRFEGIGGPPFVVKMIDLFRQNVTKRLAEVRSGHEEGNPTRIEDAVHSIRSSAGNFGAKVMFELASEIESEVAGWDQQTRSLKIEQLEGSGAGRAGSAGSS